MFKCTEIEHVFGGINGKSKYVKPYTGEGGGNSLGSPANPVLWIHKFPKHNIFVCPENT